jgi:gallate dioxygenase
VIGASNLHIYAAMRGETLDAFLQTRNAKVLYSVAAQPAVPAAEDNAPS